MFGDVDDFDFAAGRLPGPFPAFGLLVALPAHFIRIPAIVAHELEAFLRYVLGDICEAYSAVDTVQNQNSEVPMLGRIEPPPL